MIAPSKGFRNQNQVTPDGGYLCKQAKWNKSKLEVCYVVVVLSYFRWFVSKPGGRAGKKAGR
jgi:hypothetical protein